MPPHPHVILICTDDQGYGDVVCHGNPDLHTPHLDAMARASTQLENHHTDPLCSPSRAALMTGRYAARGGVWHVIQGRHLLDSRATTLADAFAADPSGSTAGYRTGMFGKWHLGDNFPYAPRFRGFQEVVCHRGGGVGELPDAWGNDYFDDTYFHNGRPQRYAGYCTDVFFREARRFLAECEAQGVPAFIYLAPNAMHSPFRAPEEYIAPYRARGVEEPRASFYGMIANFDENLGRLFADLRELGIEGRTLTVFTADHGTAAGYEPRSGRGFNAGMRGRKGSVYDGGHRVNCFLHGPGYLPAGRQIHQATAHIDLMPTLLSLCGLEAPPDLAFDGLDLSPYLSPAAPPLPPRTLFSQLQPYQPQPWHHCAVITDRWRLVNGRELYDMSADPGQQRDVAAAFPAVVVELRAAYAEFWDSLREAHADVVPLYLGAPEENPTTLSARDWHPLTEGRVLRPQSADPGIGGTRFPWFQEWIGRPEFHEANGAWDVEIRRSGEYSFALSAYPLALGRPLGARLARIRLEADSWRREVASTLAPQETAARFHLRLPAGRARLQTWLSDAGPLEQRGTRGAYYVVVEWVGG